MILHVEVTAVDIRVGSRRDCQLCPVALALQRALYRQSGEFRPVKAGTEWCRVGSHLVATPEAVREFIIRFDNPLPVEPFTFDLELS